MVIVVAADTFGAHFHFQEGDMEGARRALGRANVSVIETQRDIHEPRAVSLRRSGARVTKWWDPSLGSGHPVWKDSRAVLVEGVTLKSTTGAAGTDDGMGAASAPPRRVHPTPRSVKTLSGEERPV